MAILVCCSGIMRSASTWSYNVCRELLDRSKGRRSQALFADYAGRTDAVFARLLKLERNKGIAVRGVVKAHLVGRATRRAIGRGRIGNVFTIRDPRDAMSSMLLFGHEKDEAETTELIAYYCHVLAQGRPFLDDGRTLVVRYEAMVADPVAGVRTIARYLGLPADEALVQAVHEATCPERVAAIVARLEAGDWDGGDRSDRLTQVHVDHLHGGEVGRWRRELTPAMRARLEEAFAPYMAAYGYGGEETPRDCP